MSKRNGFTLVELMVVIVIIGVLAAVAIPKMMAAVNKARASEGPQILASIANLQTAFIGETANALTLPEGGNTPTPVGSAATDPWAALGFDLIPGSRWYKYQSTGGAALAAAMAGPVANGNQFVATGTTAAALGSVASGTILMLNWQEQRTIGGPGATEMPSLLPNWKSAAAAGGGGE